MRPLIFISNDDGVSAKGLTELVRFLRPMADLVVMAPDGPRSGASAAITSNVPVQYRQVLSEPGLEVYACTGTPVDCVKLAFETVLQRSPDLVLSGINHGDNASISVHYSGTMGVAFEGCMKGVPSIGLSLADVRPDADFELLCPYVHSLVTLVLQKGLPHGICLNVNFPSGVSLRGMRVCRMGWGRWVSEWKWAEHPAEKQAYWLTGRFDNLEAEADDTDMAALAQGYVTVVPIRLDLTDYSFMSVLKKDLEGTA